MKDYIFKYYLNSYDSVLESNINVTFITAKNIEKAREKLQKEFDEKGYKDPIFHSIEVYK